MATCYIGLGSNIGQRGLNISEALRLIDEDDRVEVAKVSTVIESPPAGGPEGQPNYYNAAAEVRTSLSASGLLELCQKVEDDLGRERDVRWGPRTIDLDILLWEGEVITTDSLQVPHPLMHERLFVMQPLAEIAPDAIHPLLGMSARSILDSIIGG